MRGKLNHVNCLISKNCKSSLYLVKTLYIIMESLNFSNTKLAWIMFIGGVLISIAIFVVGNYESPEECFLREINKWATSKEIDLGRLTDTNNSKMVVSIAKTYVDETAKGIEDGGLRMNIVALFYYCGI